ncbi:MAG: peptide ABC transporter [Thiotrichales bacterium]|nr:peptide ABC transporter [Thiotrichales bacterium]
MLTAIIRRVILVVPNIFLLTLILFWSVFSLLGTPVEMMLGRDADIATIAALNEQYGFDRPVLEQYLSWIGNALQGDFGRSYLTKESVADAIAPRVLVTLELASVAVLFAMLCTVVMNSIPVARRFFASANTGLSLIGITVPNFMLGISLIYLLSVKLGWLPTSGWRDWSDGPVDHLRHLALPAITLAAFFFGSFSLVYRAEYRAVQQNLFIKVARAKGLSEWGVSFKHSMPNSILPVITYAGLSLGQMTGGAVVTETVFSVPGMGRLFVDSITSHDFPVMLAVGMIIIVGVVLLNLLADILYTMINPRIRLE